MLAIRNAGTSSPSSFSSLKRFLDALEDASANLAMNRLSAGFFKEARITSFIRSSMPSERYSTMVNYPRMNPQAWSK